MRVKHSQEQMEPPPHPTPSNPEKPGGGRGSFPSQGSLGCVKILDDWLSPLQARNSHSPPRRWEGHRCKAAGD